jgi:hypothetical protein
MLKRALLPDGRACRTIKAGLARGIRMELDLHSQLQRYCGLDEFELSKFVKKRLLYCKSCVDIGANDGYYTLVFLRSAADQVIACEPGPVADRLYYNAEMNRLADSRRLVIERRLIGQGSDQLSLRVLVHSLVGPILVKVDVDGVEKDVLESASGSDRLSEIHWIVETHSAVLEQECIQWFASHGYRTRIVKNAWWRTLLPEQRPLAHNRWLVAEPT